MHKERKEAAYHLLEEETQGHLQETEQIGRTALSLAGDED